MDSTGWIRSTLRMFVGTVQLYVNMITSIVPTFDCTSEVSFVFEMTYRLNFDLLFFLQKSFGSAFEENFQSYSKSRFN
jgi:hypothetical protein